ncbi:MAG: lipoprotein signal peptidase [Cytophagaceae bacterium]
MEFKMQHYRFFVLTVLVVLLDQLIKVWVFNTFPSEYYDNSIPVFGDWFKIQYVTNPGMAFGIELFGEYGKLMLTSFRIIASLAIAYYIYNSSVKNAPAGFLWCVAMILGGAIGNLVDSIFYGVWFDLTTVDASTPWFHGRVIDMFYIDICYCEIPEWVPRIGGSIYPLWPIFNFADASIFVGVVLILIFQKRFFPEEKKEELVVTPTPTAEETTTEITE